jgi:SAM-dependent methyltransferase
MKSRTTPHQETILMKTLDYWFNTPLGKEAFELECNRTERYLRDMPKGTILQIGGPCLSHKPCDQRFEYISVLPSASNQRKNTQIIASIESLPFDVGCFDLIIAPHAHEMVGQIDRWISQLHELLKPEGHLILFGIRRYSLWWYQNSLSTKKPLFHWAKHLFSLHEIQKILEAQYFSIDTSNTYFFHLHQDRTTHTISFLIDRIGEMIAPQLGGLYCIVAQKKCITMTLDQSKKLTKWALKKQIPAINTQPG